jgi:hypothetical protein
MHVKSNIPVTFCYKGSIAAVLCCALLIGNFGCSQQKSSQTADAKKYVIVGIEGDIDSFNPLFAEDVTAGEVNDLFYPGLVNSTFNRDKGILEYQPLIARAG